MGRLRELLGVEPPSMTAIAAYLDGLDPETRVREIRSLRRRDQARLFEAAAGHRPLSLHDLVGASRPAMDEVVHQGKNSLPLFNHFAKAFVRPDAPESEELWGYNRAGGFVETMVGPGYFVVYPSEVRGELLVDYQRLPSARPKHWPEILPNSARLSRFVYHRTLDVLRGVSEHVSIGRVTKSGKAMSAWFVLCREDGG